MWEKIRRKVSNTMGLFLEYEVSRHRAFFPRSTGIASKDASSRIIADKQVDAFVPFKQSRLKGHANPLRPPLHVETVLIGRTLQQETGYFRGIGFRIRDNGCVEAEFSEGIEEFGSVDQFQKEVLRRSRINRNRASR